MEKFLSPQPRILAHRGDSANFPENTEPAFQAAVALGADVIETDVHLTADREVILWHDDNLKRLTGENRKISGLTAKELKTIDAGFAFTLDHGQTYPFRSKGIHLLLLRECLNRFPETRFNIDLKDNSKDLATAVAEILHEEKAQNRVCIGSFHHSPLEQFRRDSPETETSLSKKEFLLTLLLYRLGWSIQVIRRKKVRIIQMPEWHKGKRLLTEGFIRWSKKRGLILQIWTINNPKDMDRLLQKGVDGIFTDRPEELIRAAARNAGKG